MALDVGLIAAFLQDAAPRGFNHTFSSSAIEP